MRTALLFLLALTSCHAAQLQAIPPNGVKISPAETQTFLRAICPGQFNAHGCSTCPTETAFARTPMAEQLKSIIFGHFQNRITNDALLTITGCEPMAAGQTGVFLFTKDTLTWRKISYTPGIFAANCQKVLAADGRDLLVCEEMDRHANHFLQLVDLAKNPHKTNFFAISDSLNSCEGGDSGKILSVAFVPVANSRTVSITVAARLGEAEIPESALNACRLSNFKRKPIVTTVLRRYHFRFDGVKIIPEPGNPPLHNLWAVAPPTSWRLSK